MSNKIILKLKINKNSVVMLQKLPRTLYEHNVNLSASAPHSGMPSGKSRTSPLLALVISADDSFDLFKSPVNP